MLNSMTGYGEAKLNSNLGEVRIELKSVNHRYLDFKLNLPRELSPLEPELREIIRQKVKRGVIFLNLYWEKKGSGLGELRLNEKLVRSLDENLKKLQKSSKDFSPLPLGLIAGFPGVLYFTASPVKQKQAGLIVKKGLKKALDNLVKSRREEGSRLEKDIKKRLLSINKETLKVEQFLPRYRQRIKGRVKRKIEQLNIGKKIDKERLNREIAYILIRSDFTEEIVRLKSHLKSLLKLISGKTSGKNIDFFLQEINREINTLNDKASEVAISRSAIEIKAELEKLREQTLNLE